MSLLFVVTVQSYGTDCHDRRRVRSSLTFLAVSSLMCKLGSSHFCFQVEQAGITSLDGANTTVANPNYADLVAQQYATLGRTGIGTGSKQIDQEGYNYWTNQLSSGAVSPDQFKSAFNNAAKNVYINQAYQDLFGRTAEPEGLSYWTGALDTTNKQAIYDAIKGGARGQDIAKAYEYWQDHLNSIKAEYNGKNKKL